MFLSSKTEVSLSCEAALSRVIIAVCPLCSINTLGTLSTPGQMQKQEPRVKWRVQMADHCSFQLRISSRCLQLLPHSENSNSDISRTQKEELTLVCPGSMVQINHWNRERPDERFLPFNEQIPPPDLGAPHTSRWRKGREVWSLSSHLDKTLQRKEPWEEPE
jgi:hypothetical protein